MRYVVPIFLLMLLAPVCYAQDILINGSFESGLTGWTANGSYSVSVRTSYNGVSPVNGSRFLVLAGPASVGSTYARTVTQTRTASDNYLVYLSAYTYLHTTDGRNVSYALVLEPGYGQAGGMFHGGAQNAWVASQTWGYYIANDPFDSSAATKSINVVLELRDSLNQGEYLLLDNVHLYYGSPGI